MTAVEMPAEEYHRHPALSSTGARKLLPPSCPAIFKWEQEHPPEKWEFDFGRAAHKLVLGDVSAQVEVIEAKDRRTKKVQDQIAAAHERGVTPMLRKDWDRVEAMAQKIREDPIAASLLDPAGGTPEQSIFWLDEETKIERRCRVDWLRHQRAGHLIVVDYKTAASAAREKFSRSAMDYGYHQQAAWYIDAVKAAGLDSDPWFVFIVQERTEPYLVNVVELDPDDVKIGRALNRQALHVYADCLRRDRWPSYGDGDIQQVQLPGWYRNEHEELV